MTYLLDRFIILLMMETRGFTKYDEVKFSDEFNDVKFKLEECEKKSNLIDDLIGSGKEMIVPVDEVVNMVKMEKEIAELRQDINQLNKKPDVTEVNGKYYISN